MDEDVSAPFWSRLIYVFNSFRTPQSAPLEAGKSIICADILFIVEEPLIVEEPSESALALTSPGRTPSFFRLMWGQDKMWHHIEIFYSLGAREAHLFSFI